MKTIPILFLILCGVCSAETADEIAREAIREAAGYSNGLDKSPEGKRGTALSNSQSLVESYMASDEVPERIRIAYALRVLRPQLNLRIMKHGTTGLQEDKVEMAKRKKQILAKIAILEQRLIEFYESPPDDSAGKHRTTE